MAETIKSALLVDYDSLRRGLAGAGGPTDTRLADRAAAWLAAIETGRLIGPPGTRRRLVSKRCYVGPSVLGKQRNVLADAGFDVIDCGSNDGSRNPADIHIAIDTIDAISKPDAADEFILLTASADLSPLLSRLKAGRRLAAIYTDRATPEGDKTLADAVLDSADFAAFLASDEMPTDDAAGAGAASDRAEIEEFARRVHAATNIPLFSPKTYAELFKHLTEEIRENGYHFQTTARNVAERLTAAGRSATRRQVVFIVKGLALKGHVFSTSDTPDGLAEVFREQARYLVTNAGIDLDDRQDRLLNAWFVSRAPAPPPARTKPATDPAGRNGSTPPPAPPAPTPTTEAEQPAAAAPPPREPPAPAKPPQPAKPAPAYVKPTEAPKIAAKPATPIKSAPSPTAREEAKAVIAARIAASAKLRPSTRPASPAKPASSAKPSPRTSPAAATPAKPPPRKSAADQASDELETSILAAIAEAVDVLVDDSGDEDRPAADQTARRKANPRPTAAEPEPEPEQPETDGESEEDREQADDGGDIGDQIQRIIASYNRNRSDD